MNDRSWKSTHIDDIPRGGNRWIPIRKHFDIRGFGINAWQARAEGDEIIQAHKEEDSGHEELYVVTSGHATFTVDGKEIDAPTGTMLFLRDPDVERAAIAKEAGTTVVTIGAKPGEAYEVRGWEANAEMWPLYEAGDYDGAAALLQTALEEDPGDQGLLYNLACVEALAGRSEDAVGHLSQALENAPERYLETARNDSDLESIRDDPRVAELLSPR